MNDLLISVSAHCSVTLISLSSQDNFDPEVEGREKCLSNGKKTEKKTTEAHHRGLSTNCRCNVS